MTDKDKLRNVARILADTRSQIEEALLEDSEVDLGGDGINACEASMILRSIEQRVKNYFK